MREKSDTKTKSLVIECTEINEDSRKGFERLLKPRWEELNGSTRKSKEARKEFDNALDALCGEVGALLRDCCNIAALSLAAGETAPSLFEGTGSGGSNRIKHADAFFICEVAEIYERYFQKPPKAIMLGSFEEFLSIVTVAAHPSDVDFSYSLRSLREGLKYFSATRNFVVVKEAKPDLSELDQFIRSFYS